jgi:hypothetical protein
VLEHCLFFNFRVLGGGTRTCSKSTRTCIVEFIDIGFVKKEVFNIDRSLDYHILKTHTASLLAVEWIWRLGDCGRITLIEIMTSMIQSTSFEGVDLYRVRLSLESLLSIAE